jgi:hypothetical protein
MTLSEDDCAQQAVSRSGVPKNIGFRITDCCNGLERDGRLA